MPFAGCSTAREAKKDILVGIGRGEVLGGGDVMEPMTGCSRRSSHCRALSRSTESARRKIHSIQVDLQGLCGANPVPVNQGVLLALFLQLACDIADEISLKLQWIQRMSLLNPHNWEL